MAGHLHHDDGHQDSDDIFEDSMEDSGVQNEGDNSALDQSNQDYSLMTEEEYTQADIDAQLFLGSDQPELELEIAKENVKEARAGKAAADKKASDARAVQAGRQAMAGGQAGQAAQPGPPSQTATDNGTQSAPVIGAVPGTTPKPPTGSIPGTRFAPEYKSTFTCEAAIHDPQLLPLLAHVNCSYLSTNGNSPTLTELKQHVQSLVVLIKALTVTTNSAYIDNANLSAMMEDAVAFHDGETYDFLNDLNNHYDGPATAQLKTHHSMPLNSALNVIEVVQVIPTQNGCVCAGGKQAPQPLTGKAKQQQRGHNPNAIPATAQEVLEHICPLREAYQAAPNQVSLPWAQHDNLIRHANEILELLDHEYSAKGGLLSILPLKEQKEDRAYAETTILGQLILHMQRLVIRCHDLERLYANATDAMASEAVIPAQTLSRLGPDGRKGRELVYPQDRFVLVNCGEDVYSFLCNAFDRKDIQDEEIMKLHLRNGSTGEALWRQKDGRDYSRGITALDVVTRYYRIRGDEKAGQANKTIFVIPAHAEHPGVKVTREMEQQPTVVAVVKPQWPERQSIMEMKHRQDLKDYKDLKEKARRLMDEQINIESSREHLRQTLTVRDGTIFHLKEKLDAHETALKLPENEAKAALIAKFYTQANKVKEQAEKVATKVEAEKAGVEAAKKEGDAVLANILAQQKKWDKDLATMRAHETAERQKRVQKLREADEESARVATMLEAKMREYWQRQVQETQILIEHLKQRNVDYGKEVPSQETVDKGNKIGASAFSTLVSGGGQTWLQPGNQNDPDYNNGNEETSGFKHESDESMDDYDCCNH